MDEDELVHVSGHPGKDDIVKLYNLIKPQISISVHGTSRHLREHCGNCRKLWCFIINTT